MSAFAHIVLLGLVPLALRPLEAAAAASDRALATEPRWTDEEIFRRAFWRHPSATDRILHAERREPAAETAPDEPQSWQWFLAVHPSTALLASLRDPATFGLTTTTTARPWPTAPASPDWFPAPGSWTGFEVLQAPIGHLTVLYRERDNLLFATDTGGGFAPAARPLDDPGKPPAP